MIWVDAMLRYGDMSLPQSISQHLTKDHQVRLDDARLFDVIEVFDVEGHQSLLILKKRRSPALKYALAALLVATIGLMATWCIYYYPNSHSIWLLCFLMWCLIGPAIVVPNLLEVWRAWHGDVWTIDGGDGHLEHNGCKLDISNQATFVRAWQEECEGTIESHLEIISVDGPPIVIGYRGTWEEFSVLAQRIADYAHLPLKLEPILT